MLFLENLSVEERQHSFNTLQQLSLPTRRYFILTILGVIIATFGMLMNNSAIIIGAMLVAPLMLPILALSISIISGHTKLMIRSLITLFKGIILSIIIATFISLFIPIFELPQEVLNRAKPAILDLFIALAAGAAAMYATIKKDSATLPGVAISVSLMPPLGAVGIGLAIRNFDIASGAALLFLTNLVAIIISGVFILFLFGFRANSKDEQGVLRQSVIVNLALLTVLSIILTTSFLKITLEEKKKYEIKDELTRQLKTLGKGNLESFKVDNKKGETFISATILSSKNLTKEDMEYLTNALVYRLEESVNLEATIIPVAIEGRYLPESEKEEIKKEKEKKIDASNLTPNRNPASEPIMAPMEPENPNKDFIPAYTPVPKQAPNYEEYFPFIEE